tara:strand:- start:482 stop:643 length:162 start_codon:yes stop_codon:yes gene_type:complete
VSTFKITVKVPVGHDGSVRRMMIIELQANSLMEALQVARGTYGANNVFGGVSA